MGLIPITLFIVVIAKHGTEACSDPMVMEWMYGAIAQAVVSLIYALTIGPKMVEYQVEMKHHLEKSQPGDAENPNPKFDPNYKGEMPMPGGAIKLGNCLMCPVGIFSIVWYIMGMVSVFNVKSELVPTGPIIDCSETGATLQVYFIIVLCMPFACCCFMACCLPMLAANAAADAEADATAAGTAEQPAEESDPSKEQPAEAEQAV